MTEEFVGTKLKLRKLLRFLDDSSAHDSQFVFSQPPLLSAYCLGVACSPASFRSAYKVDVGYNRLRNEIGAGLANGGHGQGVTNIGVPERVKPDIVSPQGTTSAATPLVSSAAASILLTWNAQYKNANGDFDTSLSLANMDLKLFNSSNGILHDCSVLGFEYQLRHGMEHYSSS